MESRVATSTASPLAVLRPGSLTAYWRFQRAVAKAQLTAWLPAGRRLLVDISGPAASGPAQAAASGHAVVRVVPAHPGTRGAAEQAGPLSRIAPVVAEAGSLAFLADGCADGVIAEDGALSRHLMAEDLATEITRVLRPGAMARLVRAELQAGQDPAGVSADESFGISLVATARKPPHGG